MTIKRSIVLTMLTILVTTTATTHAQSFEQVTSGLNGMPLDANAVIVDASADGRFVLIRSEATNLVADDTNGVRDGFVIDRELALVERVTVDTDGSEANGSSGASSVISDDGRFVVFSSIASNFVGGATDGSTTLFLRDRQLAQTRPINLDTNGTVADQTGPPEIAGDGSVVVFTADFDQDPSLDSTPGILDLWRYEVSSGTISLLNEPGQNVTDANGFPDTIVFPAINSDGTLAAFSSAMTNLAADDTNGEVDTFVTDLSTNTTQRISLGVNQQQVSGNTLAAFNGSVRISDDGRYVTFKSTSPELVAPTLPDSLSRIFRYDRQTGQIQLVSPALSNMRVFAHDLSADGDVLVFSTLASNLVPTDTNTSTDLYAYRISENTLFLLSADPSTGMAIGDIVGEVFVRASGTLALFISNTAYADTDTNATADVFEVSIPPADKLFSDGFEA